jgi:anti-anti-sigma factor
MTSACELQEQLLIQFHGSMDTARCEKVGQDIRAQLANPTQPVVFDLADVHFISSSFLRLCVYAARQAGEHGFQVVDVSPTIQRVFKIAGLDGMLGPQ